MTKSDYAFISSWSKKKRAIEVLGGKCQICGYRIWPCLVFHHLGNKEKEIGNLRAYRWSMILKELSKCILLCGNCHVEKHTNVGSRAFSARKVLLQWKGQHFCSECGYQSKNYSLDFHHNESGGKEFNLRDFTARRQVSLEEAIVEVDKCIVLCRNCHVLRHLNLERLIRLKDIIENKAENMIENRMPLDREKIMQMSCSGIGVCSIAKILGYPKSTVSTVLKKARDPVAQSSRAQAC